VHLPQLQARHQATPESEELSTQGLDALFGPADPQSPQHSQRLACAMALRQRTCIITGGPGTGKTTTVMRLLALLQQAHGSAPLRVLLAAPTGKAAARLKQSIDAALLTLAPALQGHGDLLQWVAHIGPAQTLHRLLGARPDARAFQRNARQPLDVDLLIVDEAETLTPHQLHTLRRLRDLANVGIVLAGTEWLTGLIKPERGQFDQIRSRCGFWPETVRGITAEDAAALVGRLAEAGELSVRDLLLGFPVERRRAVQMSLVWLAKIGVVDWLPPQA
jgi:type II secretory pathway predicted ATPase ExeA